MNRGRHPTETAVQEADASRTGGLDRLDHVINALRITAGQITENHEVADFEARGPGDLRRELELGGQIFLDK